MGAILVFLQHEKGRLPKSTLAAIGVAATLKASWQHDRLIGVAVGTGAAAAGQDALHYGLDQALTNEDAAFDTYLATPFAAALKSAVENAAADTVVLAATSSGKDLAPRLAGLLDAGQASDIVAVNSDGSLRRPMYAGDILADVELTTAKKVVTVRATAFAPALRGNASGSATPLSLNVDRSKAGELVSSEISKGGRPELGDAAIVVSGGRAVGSAENFERVVFPLADALGAAVGASRAAVDSGYAPNDWQVGQTGKIVSPNLYIAVGISGAIQHLAGMKDSKVIVAINKDAEAPIFEIADYGLVADLFDVVPKLTDKIKQLRSS